MQINPISSTTRIYLQQINNYIATGQGYQQLRVHLLKELNQLDSENQNSDETLVSALIQNLRRSLMEDSSQRRSRVIDVIIGVKQVIEDLIKYADQIVGSYLTSQQFCITVQTALTYKLFNPFSKAIFDQNRLRLGSILLYYYQRFQSDPNRYIHVFETYKQLKQKNCTFPPKTYIVVPKVNEFKKKLTMKKTSSDKSSDSERIGVTFDSIIGFVSQCESQFRNNKLSCANTQFVRALKVKAKTLFDLTQNTQGIELNSKQKDHAKQLYKQIRTMLKEIEKISEEKIKEQKIKSEKEFAQQKIEQITPKKKQRSVTQQLTKDIKQVETRDLLEGIEEQSEKHASNIVTPTKKKESSLLDDNDDNEFTQFVSEAQPAEIEKTKQSNYTKLAPTDGLKPLKKPPRFNQNALKQTSVTTDDILIDTVEPKVKTPKKTIHKKQPQQLIDTKLQGSVFSKKSIHSVHSLHSQQSDKGINFKEESTQQPQGQDILDLQNQKHFSKFQILNTITAKLTDPNAYNVIPNDIDFSDSSSQSGNRVTFQMNKNTFFSQEATQPYDRTFLTPKKQAAQLQKTLQHVTRSHQDLQKPSLSTSYQQQQKQQLEPNYDFGVLADTREVIAYDYSNLQNLEKTSISNFSEDEERKIAFTPQSIKKPKGIASMNELEPNMMSFNSQKKLQKGHEHLQGDDEDEEFEEYQQVGQQEVDLLKEIKSDKETMKENNNQCRILVDKTPQKNTLLEQNGSPASNGEPLL